MVALKHGIPNIYLVLEGTRLQEFTPIRIDEGHFKLLLGLAFVENQNSLKR